MLRRLSTSVLRHCRTRGGGGGGGSFWSEGKKPAGEGYLFGETPPPNGQARKWESWESPWLVGYGAMFIMGLVIAFGKPEEAASIRAWAKKKALAELEEEDAIFAQLHEDPQHLKDVKAQMAAQGKAFDEYYDTIMSRKELAVLKQQYAE